jgi:hypothetical protein
MTSIKCKVCGRKHKKHPTSTYGQQVKMFGY